MKYQCEEHPNLGIKVTALSKDGRRVTARFKNQLYDVNADPELRTDEERAAVVQAIEDVMRRGLAPIFKSSGLVAHRCGLCDYSHPDPAAVAAHRKARHKGSPALAEIEATERALAAAASA